MISLIKSLFSSSSVLEVGAKAIDNAFYTDQEKSEYKKELLKLDIEFQKSTSGQNKARRLLALISSLSFYFFIFLGVGVNIFERYNKIEHSSSEFIFTMLNETMLYPFLLVMTFYFGKGFVDNFVNKVK